MSAPDLVLVTAVTRAVQDALEADATDRVSAGKPALSRSGQEALAYKVLGLASHLVIICLIWWIAGQWNRVGITTASRAVAVAMWVWNPLVNVEIVGSAHNEGFMSVFGLLAFALLTAALQHSAHPPR